MIEGVIGNAKNYHVIKEAEFMDKDKIIYLFLHAGSAINLKAMIKLLVLRKIKRSF